MHFFFFYNLDCCKEVKKNRVKDIVRGILKSSFYTMKKKEKLIMALLEVKNVKKIIYDSFWGQ